MLKELATKLKTSDTPVIERIYNQNGTKLIAIGLKKDVTLAEHTAPSKAKLIMAKGEVDFNIDGKSLRFDALDTYDIPLKVKHSVVALEDTVFLLLLSE